MAKRLLSQLTAAALFGAFGLSAVQAQQVVLKVHHFLPSTSNAQVNIIQPWCDKINKESNDRLKCQIYPAMQLGGTPPQLFDQVRDGVADIVWTVPTYASGRFTKSEVFELPFMTVHAKTGSMAFWDYVQKNSLDEFKGTHPIFLHVHDGTVLHTTSKKVTKLEDVKGLKIRGATRLNTRMITALGGTPVQMPLPAVPEAMTKGVIDGAFVPWEGVPAIKLQEIAKFSLGVPEGQPRFANTIFGFLMNQAKYDSLPPELKKVIDDNGGLAMSALAGEKFDATVEPNRKLARDNGDTLSFLTMEEYERWVKATGSVDDDWVKEIAAKGGDGRKLIDEAKALIKKYQQ